MHPHRWSNSLGVAEFAANNAINVSTGYTPFYLNARKDPAPLEDLQVPLGSASNQAMREAIGQKKKAFDDVKLNLVKIQERTNTEVDNTKRSD